MSDLRTLRDFTVDELQAAIEAIITLEELFGEECVNQEFADAIRYELSKRV